MYYPLINKFIQNSFQFVILDSINIKFLIMKFHKMIEQNFKFNKHRYLNGAAMKRNL